jgi:hypothetical protein
VAGRSTDGGHEIVGDDMQAVILSMGAGDVVRAEAGAMMFMTDTIEMDAKMEGGFLGGLKRTFLSGESFLITYFRSNGGAGRVAFAGPYIPARLPRSNSGDSSSHAPDAAAGSGPWGDHRVFARRRQGNRHRRAISDG